MNKHCFIYITCVYREDDRSTEQEQKKGRTQWDLQIETFGKSEKEGCILTLSSLKLFGLRGMY